jgi:hypothetical protein
MGIEDASKSEAHRNEPRPDLLVAEEYMIIGFWAQGAPGRRDEETRRRLLPSNL